MPQKLKLEADASQRFQTTLGDQAVSIELAWHDISESWFITIELASGLVVVGARRLSTNTPVLSAIFTSEFSGEIIPVSLATPVGDLARDSFVTTHTLTYYAEGENYADLP